MGAPLLEQAVGKVAYISVSHSAEWVAVMFSTTRCGVDIESHQRNFSKVATRYITPEEREAFAEAIGPHFEAIVWSAKEAMYKYALTPGVDFTADLLLVEHDGQSATLGATLNGLPIPDTRYLFLEDNQVLCYTFEF
jgi:phosphopantetheinyl transferase